MRMMNKKKESEKYGRRMAGSRGRKFLEAR